MLSNCIYFDNSATTPVFKEVMDEIVTNYNEDFFNPSSLYKPALIVRQKVENCREKLATILSCKSNGVYFTASGTDANNLAILTATKNLKQGDVVLFSAIEHPSISNTCKSINKSGAIVQTIPVDNSGRVDLDILKSVLSEKVKLICVMHVNNEVGSINDIKAICKLRDEFAKNAYIHVDGIQSFMKVQFSFKEFNVQSYSISAHKIHALKGVGVIAFSNVDPVQYRLGGGQERGIISGTENTTGILALSKAIDVYSQFTGSSKYMYELKNSFLEKLKKAIPSLIVIGPDPKDNLQSSPNIINIALPPLRSDVLVNALDAENIYISSGSACSSKKQKISSVLKAMQIQARIAESAVRVSFSILNTEEEVANAVYKISDIFNKFSKYTRR